MSTDTVHCFKILTIGESGVGKTCILRRFVENKFLKNHLATIGIDFKTKNIEVDGTPIKLKIWDTAGQERFRNITNQYYKGADGIILVFDVTEQKSFEKIKEWMSQIRANTQADQIGLVLLGNKCDIEPRAISPSDGKALGEELGKVEYYETSALNGSGITKAFEFLAKNILEKKKIDLKNQKGTNGGMNLDGGETPQKKECCK